MHNEQSVHGSLLMLFQPLYAMNRGAQATEVAGKFCEGMIKTWCVMVPWTSCKAEGAMQ